MSWAVEEWKEGLPTKALQKIQEIEIQLDKLKKERQQRQFQVETLEAALLKQKQKVENEKTESSALKREHQTLIDSCENLEKTKQKISHDLQVKESQVNYLEGQLASSKKLVEKLEQENKRWKSELERCQAIGMPADGSSGTPKTNCSRSITPNKNVVDSKLEEMQEKYNKEVEERCRLETELKIIQAKFNQTQHQNTISQRNIARQRSASSVFPWQQDQTPSQHASHSLETPLRGVAMNLQWEQEETPFKHYPKSLQRGNCSTGWLNNNTDSSKLEEQLKLQNQELQTKVLDLEHRLEAQEKEVKNHMNKLHEIQFQFEKAKTELSEKERKLTKNREELTKMTTQCEQSNAKCVMVEQKLKQVSDELNCCRQNAESTRRNVEQKLKDKEKEFQEEISHHQHSLRSLDQQFIQTKNKLNQELQQAKKDYNVLQLDVDKLTAGKQKLEKELDDIKQQLRQSNQIQKANQSKENDLKKKLEDLQEERDGLRSQLQQNFTQIHKLENELQKTKQDFNRASTYGEDLKSKINELDFELKNLQQQLDDQNRSSGITVENLKQQISKMKMEQDAVRKDMKEKERSIEQLNDQIAKMENKNEGLQNEVQLKEKTCQNLEEENSSLAQWKAENTQALDIFKHEKEGLQNKIKELDQNLEFFKNKNQEQEQNLEIYQNKTEKQSETLKLLDDEKQSLQRQFEDVKQMLDNKALELQKEKQAFEEFMIKSKQDKHDVENLNLTISQLTSQIAELEKSLQQETNKVLKLEESQRVFSAEYENVSNMAKSKDDQINLKETEILKLKDSISQVTQDFEMQLARVETEKKHLMQEHEKSMLDKVEVEVARAALENDIIVLKGEITSQDSLLKLEQHLRSELQSKYETVLKEREELEENIEEAGKKCENLKVELGEEINKLKMQHAVLQATIDEKDKSIQNFTQELESNMNNLKCLQMMNKELETKLEAHFLSEKCIQEKEELINLKEKTLGQLSEENEELKASVHNLMQENMELNKKNSTFVDMMKKEEEMHEALAKYKEESATKDIIINDLKTLCEELTAKHGLLESTVEAKENAITQLMEKMNEGESRQSELMHECTVLEEQIKNLQDKCTAEKENNNFLEKQLCERANALLMKNAEVEELERKCTDASVDYNSKIAGYEAKVKALVEEMGDLQGQMEKIKEIDHLQKELAESNARQNKILEDYNQLLQDKDQLTQLIQTQAVKENIFEAKIEKLESDLATVESENIKSSKLITENNIISDQLRDTIITKENELQRLQVQLQILQMDLEDKEASLESCLCQLKQLQTDDKILESKLQHSEENRVVLEKKVSTMQEEMEVVHLRIRESKNNEESLLEEISWQKQTIDRLKIELEKKEKDFCSLGNQLNASQAKEKQYHQKETEILDLQDKLSKSETDVIELRSQKSNLEFQLDSLQQELNAQMQSTLNNIKNTLQLNEEQRVLLQQDLSKMQSELQQSEEQRISLQEDLSKMESEMQQSDKQRALLQQDLSKMQSELQQSEDQRALLQKDLSKMQSELQQSEDQRVLLQQDLSKMQSELQQSEKQRALLQQDLSKIQSELLQSEEQRALLQQDLSKIQSELLQSEEQRALLQQDLSKIQSELLQSEEQRALLQQDLSKMQSELQQSEKQRICVQQNLSEVQSKLSPKILHLTEYLPHKLIGECENNIQYENEDMTADMHTDLLNKVNLTKQSTGADASDYTKLNEIVIMPQEIRHQNILEEEATCSVVNNNSLCGNKNILSINEKHNDAVEEMKAELSLLQSNLIEAQSALSGAKIEKETLQAQLRMLESSLESAHLHVSEQKDSLQQSEMMIQEQANELILLRQQLKEQPANLNDQAAPSDEDTDLKVKSLELEICSESTEQSVALLQEQLFKQQADADAKIQALQHTITTTRQALESLKQQHSSERDEWQLKLTNLTTEMENKLAAQKQQTELLSAELEGARIQLQSLDLSSQSLLNASYFSKEDTPQKLSHTSLKKQDESNIFADKLDVVNMLTMTPDSKVQSSSEEKHVLSSDHTNSFDDNGKLSMVTNDLNEDGGNHQYIVKQIYLKEEELNDPGNLHHEASINTQVQTEQEKIKTTEVLLSEMEGLHSNLQKELFSKAADTDLETKVMILEKEKNCLSNELKSSALENQDLSNKAKNLEEELNDMKTQLQVDESKISEMAKILESLEKDKRDKNEQFLELEMELKCTKSNKANLENHILDMEDDLDKLKTKEHALEKELESAQQVFHVQAEKLTELEAKNTKILQDLDTLAETNEKLEKANNSLKIKVQEFEAEKIYNANTNSLLEAEIRELTSQLQTVANRMEQVLKEKEDLTKQLQHLENNAKLGIKEKEEFQKQLNQLKEESLSMHEQTEDLQNKISMIELENVKLLQSLESSLLEKDEVVSKLNSTKTEVAEMRHAIERLKVRIEADQKKSLDMAAKLKASDRKADSLQDKIEALERELQASEENTEDLVMQAETAKEQVEVLEEEKKAIAEKLELLVVELNTLSSDKQDLEKQLLQNQEKLEDHCSNLLRNSEAAENEKLKMTEAYESSINELETQISHLNEKLKNSHEELEGLKENEKNHIDRNSCLECEKVQLSNQLQEVAGLNVSLQSANTMLNKDLQILQQKLNDHMEEKEKLQQQVTDLENLRQKNLTDLYHLQTEMEKLMKECQNLQKTAAESQQAAHDLSAKHNAMLITMEASEKQLKEELNTAQLKASAHLDQINELTENNNKLQSDLTIANEKILQIQQDFDKEKNSISAQLEEFRSQTESFKLQLEFSQSEKCKLEKDLVYLQNELQVTDILKKQVEDYKQSISCIQEDHQVVLKNVQEKHKAELQTYQEEIVGMKQQLTAKEVEINNLKSAKEAANTVLKDDNCKVEELEKSVAKLRRDKDCAQSKLLLWMKSCKQLEHEKESLKKHIQQQEELLTKLQKSQNSDTNSQVEELNAELEELKESLEEKTKQADENMEKYWNLIKSTHKLEEENELLKGRVALLNNKLQQPYSANEESVAEQPAVATSEADVHEESEKMSPGQSNNQQTHLKSPEVSSVSGLGRDATMKLGVSKSHKRSPDGQFKHTTKRFRGAESKKEENEMKPEAAQNILKKSGCGEAQDATSCDPDKVMMGFVEVPAASPSPYTLRRTTLFNRANSILAAQSRVSPSGRKGVTQTSKKSETTAEGSHIHQHPSESRCSPPALFPGLVPAVAQSPLSSLTNSLKKKSFVGLDGKHLQSRRSPNVNKSIESKKQHKEQIAQTEGNDNCKVQ
ncbi:centromere protein F [Hypanus sabinus]|uniref:centromere protein F n=1 Tax=Hypanus sabinus TaxID=79690 RepID=UPI0028C4FB12|nr:centromere protein F [Hypanus sabinus]